MLRDDLNLADFIRLALAHAEHPGMCESDESQEPRRSEAVARAVLAHLGLTEEQDTHPVWGACHACGQSSDECRPPGIEAFMAQRCCPECRHMEFVPKQRLVGPWRVVTEQETK